MGVGAAIGAGLAAAGISTGTAVLAGTTLAASGIGALASLSAAKTQAKSAQNALSTETDMYNQSRNDLAPYRDVGQNALGTINSLYGYGQAGAGGVGATPGAGTPDYSAFYNSPDYKFALQQGGLTVDRSAASKGLLMSGGTIKDQMAFGQGLASQQYGNYFSRLMQVAGLGASAASGSAQNANAFGTTAGNTQQQIGAAQASGPVGLANALSTLPQNLLYASLAGGNPSGYQAPSSTSGPSFGTGPGGSIGGYRSITG